MIIVPDPVELVDEPLPSIDEEYFTPGPEDLCPHCRAPAVWGKGECCPAAYEQYRERLAEMKVMADAADKYRERYADSMDMLKLLREEAARMSKEYEDRKWAEPEQLKLF